MFSPLRLRTLATRAAAFGALALLVTSIGAATVPQRHLAARATPADVLGEELYLRDCGYCHGPDGEGSPRGVPLEGVGQASVHFYVSTGRMPIERGDDRPQRDDPRYGDIEIDALVAYAARFGGPGVPEVDVRRGDVVRGGALYRENCAQCHGSTGVGVALAFDVVAPSVLPSTATQTVEAMVVGPGAMPVFTPAVVSSDEAVDVAAFVDHLARQPEPGGLPLARTGRLDELLVTWAAVGLVIVALKRITSHR